MLSFKSVNKFLEELEFNIFYAIIGGFGSFLSIGNAETVKLKIFHVFVGCISAIYFTDFFYSILKNFLPEIKVYFVCFIVGMSAMRISTIINNIITKFGDIFSIYFLESIKSKFIKK